MKTDMDVELRRANVFDKPGKWFKGAIHLHTTASDGKLSPDEALHWYKTHGYDFVCFGDHWRVTTPVDPEGKMLVIPGCEIDTWNDATVGNTHIMCVGVEGHHEDFRPATRPTVAQLCELAQSICQYRIVAHPYWSTHSAESIKSLKGISALEVYNHLFDETAAMGYAEYPWHMLLNEGCELDATAVDDAHGGVESLGHGWVMVKATTCTQEAIVAALQAGDFYATQGPEIRSVGFGGMTLVVQTSPAQRIIIRTNQFFGAINTAVGGEAVTSARAKIDLVEMNHMRIEVEDTQGRKAWSNPFYFTNSLMRPKARTESSACGTAEL